MTPAACHLIFRLEGVVTQTFEGALFSVVAGSTAVADPKARLAVRDLASAMRSGKLDWTGLCSRAALILGVREDGSSLGERILNSLRVDAGIEELLISINGVLDSWLFCEIDGNDIVSAMERLGIERCIPRTRWLFSSEDRQRLRVDVPRELIAAIAERVKAPRETLLWIDDRPRVTAALIRAGMNAVAFVDAFRLQRNLVLRGLLQ